MNEISSCRLQPRPAGRRRSRGSGHGQSASAVVTRPARSAAAIAAVSLGLLAAGCAAAAPHHGVGAAAAAGQAAGAVSRPALAGAPRGQIGEAASTPFAVMLGHAFGSRPAVVVDMRTGRSTGRVPVPVAGSSFEWVAAEPSDHAFVLADESQNLIYRFYRLRLGRHGRPLGLARLRVPALHAAQIYGLAVTADGSKLAIAWLNESARPQHARIEVVRLATGAVRTWASARGAATSLSWAGDRTLAFTWQGLRARGSGIRLLDTAVPGTDPLASRLLIPYATRFRGLTSPSLQVLTPDQATIIASMAGGPHKDLVAIVAFSARTGRPSRIIAPAASTTSQRPLYCGVAWTDRTGKHLITQCGTTQLRIDGTRATRIRIPALPASPVGYANAFAW